jgi:hypothetical protein
MAPEGLQLLQAATLTIDSPKTAAAQGFETVAFGFRQSGKGLYLSPAQVSGKVISIEVWHFSGDGAAQATGAEVAAQQEQHVPSIAEDAFTQDMQQLESRERQAQLLGQGDNAQFGEALIAATHRAFRDFLQPQLAIALADCGRAPAILARALGAKRQMEMMGTENAAGGASSNVFQAELDQLDRTMQQVITTCYNKEYDECVIDKKMEHKSAMQQIFGQASQLGLAAELDPSKIDKCPPVVGYRATWQGNMTGSGVVCSLEQPFTVEGVSSGGMNMAWKFVPAGPQSGTASYDENAADTHWTGSGPYTVQGTGTEERSIAVQGEGCAATSGQQICQGFSVSMNLTPLDTKECSQP